MLLQKAFANFPCSYTKHAKQDFKTHQTKSLPKLRAISHCLPMDFHLKQWRNQHESEQSPSANMPKLLVDDPHQQQPQQHQHQQQPSGSAALPLFAPEPNSKISNLSAFPETNTAATTRFPRMGIHFSLAQWQELELQALIYRYMLAGVAVPSELLQSIKKSFIHSSHYFLHHPPLQQYPHYQPALWQTGYWGRVAMDPEPGRCRRTDGKKWRCSRDVVGGQKYCERHVHRGRNRSRKPVEIPTPISTATTTGGGGGVGVAASGGDVGAAFNTVASAGSPSLVSGAKGNKFSVSAQSPSVDLLHLNHSSLDSKTEIKGFLAPQNDVGARADGHILRHFFDDWPRPLQEPEKAGSNANPRTNSATCLSISMPGNSPSDVSLKLSTGNGEEAPPTRGIEQLHHNWSAGWGAGQVASMGGPLAEALRSSTSNSSPTSVLRQVPRGSASETSYVSA